MAGYYGRWRRRRKRGKLVRLVRSVIFGPRRQDSAFAFYIKNVDRGDEIDNTHCMAITATNTRFPRTDQGTATANRIGQRIFVKAVKLQGYLDKPGTLNTLTCQPQDQKLHVLVWKQRTLIGGGATTVPTYDPKDFFYTQAGSWPSQYEVNNQHKMALLTDYEIVYRRSISLTAISSDPSNISSDKKRLSLYIPLGFICEYDGTDDFPEYNPFWIYTWVESSDPTGDTSANRWKFTGTMNTFFRDRGV